jgi:hypothetical protein
MPKYYCSTGELQNIVDAENYFDAAKKTLSKAIKNHIDTNVLISINEKGFKSDESLLTPVIPILRKMGYDDKTNGEWIDIVCEMLNSSFEEINSRQLKWLITGIMEEDKKDGNKI